MQQRDMVGKHVLGCVFVSERTQVIALHKLQGGRV